METFLYADDTMIIATGDNEVDITCTLMVALEHAGMWMDKNKLSLNVSKTKCMFFGSTARYSNCTLIPMEYREQAVEHVNNFKYLGIHLDNCLKFTHHVDYVKRKVFVKMKSLARIRKFVNMGLALQLYNSLILPHFDYGYIVYAPMSNKCANTLWVLQNGCLRVCLLVGRESDIQTLHAVTNTLLLDTRRKQHGCNLVYKGLHQLSTPTINNMFNYVHERHPKTMRSSTNLKLDVPRCKLKITQGNLRHRGPRYYNTVPADVRCCVTFDRFKSIKLQSLPSDISGDVSVSFQ